VTDHRGKRVCVFCGSLRGRSPAYAQAARATGQALAARGLGLVYGGSSIGTMRILADAALAGGAEVIGVLPESLRDRELAHEGLTELHSVRGMHERKAMMTALSDAFLVLPGGHGTLDELFEALTWSQLGYHQKKIGIWNVQGYWTPLLDMMDHMVAEQFVEPGNRARLLSGDELGPLLDRLFA
jgi:uncharacterized protein (TIGR00730 family)